MAQPTGTVNTTFYNDPLLQRRTDKIFRDDPIKTLQYRRFPFDDTSAAKTDTFTPDGHMMNVKQGPLYINDLYTGRMQNGIQPNIAKTLPEVPYVNKNNLKPITRNNGVQTVQQVTVGVQAVPVVAGMGELLAGPQKVAQYEKIGAEDMGYTETVNGILAQVNTSALITSQRGSGQVVAPVLSQRQLGTNARELLDADVVAPRRNTLGAGPVNRVFGVEVQTTVGSGARRGVLGNRNHGGTGDHGTSSPRTLIAAREPLERMSLQMPHNREVIPRRGTYPTDRLPRDPVSAMRTPLRYASGMESGIPAFAGDISPNGRHVRSPRGTILAGNILEHERSNASTGVGEYERHYLRRW